MWCSDLDTAFLLSLIFSFFFSLTHFLSLSFPLRCTAVLADTHILSVSLSTLCFLSFSLNVFVAPVFLRWRLYSSSFYRLFFSFTLSILHLHTPSSILFNHFFPSFSIGAHPFPSFFFSFLFLVFILVSSPLHCLLFSLLFFLQWRLRLFTVSERVNVMNSVSRRVTSWRWVWVCMCVCVHAIVHCEH